MGAAKLLTTSLLSFALSCNAFAEYDPKFMRALAAVKERLPDRQLHIWTSAEGDLNGDGIRDLALIVTAPKDDGPYDERLVVLIGNPDESYSVLSMSDEFCHVRKFYNLDIKKNSLFVQGIESIDSDASSSFTLQFRYKPKLNDLELIGRQDLSEEYEKNSNYRISINYLSKEIVHSRKTGKQYKEVKAPINMSGLSRLQGFNCLDDNINEILPRVYIEEDFSVKK